MQSNHTAVIAVLLSAFVAPGARAAAQVPANPCAEITDAEVSTALGETVDAGKQGPTLTCTWVANKPSHQIVTLSFSPPGGYDAIKTRDHPGVTKAAVSGVGDDAFAQTAANFATLFVKKGSVTYMVRVYGVPDPAKQIAIETPIAQRVAAKF